MAFAQCEGRAMYNSLDSVVQSIRWFVILSCIRRIGGGVKMLIESDTVPTLCGQLEKKLIKFLIEEYLTNRFISCTSIE